MTSEICLFCLYLCCPFVTVIYSIVLFCCLVIAQDPTALLYLLLEIWLPYCAALLLPKGKSAQAETFRAAYYQFVALSRQPKPAASCQVLL